MSDKTKSDQEYDHYSQEIERKAAEELKKIQEKIEAAKKEAEKIGAAVEAGDKS